MADGTTIDRSQTIDRFPSFADLQKEHLALMQSPAFG
jgi:hypothetical protein